MFILQFINSSSNEIINEIRSETPKQFLSMLTDFENCKGEECFLFDFRQRTVSAVYERNEMDSEGKNTVYKLYFTASLAVRETPFTNHK